MIETVTENVLQPVLVTFKHSALTRADIGKPVKVSANDTVQLAADGNAFDGILATVETGVCGVLVSGDVTLEYSGSDPDTGFQPLVAATGGKVKLEGSPLDYNYWQVWWVDTTEKKVRFRLP
ncbi:MAG: hypothetical protein HS115_11720 [Spirochaetales bacterium]|nr:hypothetical protein [Spirochaetales bacterium]